MNWYPENEGLALHACFLRLRQCWLVNTGDCRCLAALCSPVESRSSTTLAQLYICTWGSTQGPCRKARFTCPSKNQTSNCAIWHLASLPGTSIQKTPCLPVAHFFKSCVGRGSELQLFVLAFIMSLFVLSKDIGLKVLNGVISLLVGSSRVISEENFH